MFNVVPVKIRAVKRVPSQPVYDLQIKKNGNFFANSILVHNCLIFQESVMELAEKVAGFPKDKCDEVRRAIMKRSISGGEAAKKAAQETRDSFVHRCHVEGINHEFDFYVPNENILVEFDGDYWHGNPEKHELTSKMKRQYRLDESFTRAAEARGYVVRRVWGSEAVNYPHNLRTI
jgi:very-short-patch-repair endonuclease